MTVRYRAAIIGCGRIARAHANGYSGMEGCELVSCSDIFPEAAAKLAEEYKIPRVYTDYREMLAETRPDLVSICTYHHLHYELTVGAAAYKPKAIYCEKPMAMHVSEADEMIRVCRDNGVLLLIGHQRRYGPQYRKAKELLDSGEIGELVHMECYGHPWSSLFVDGTHSIDLLRYYNNDLPVDWVMGQVDVKSGSHRFGHPNEGASLAMLYFSNGVRAVLTTGGFSPSQAPFPAKDGVALGAEVPPHGYHKIILHGTRGRLEIDGDDIVQGDTILRIHRGAEVEPIAVDLKKREAFQSALADVLASLETGKPHLLHAESGRATLAVISAIFQSSKERTLVYLHQVQGANPLYELITDQQP